MIRCAQRKDWQCFLNLAASEGWRVPALESRLFQDTWQEHAYALSVGNCFCGLVTAVPHQKSGWIGNLVVPAELRGQGYGKQLFDAAVDRLKVQGVTSFWLTASRLGQPIYEKAGFAEVDEIERWVSPTRPPAAASQKQHLGERHSLGAADRAAWGEPRSALLEAVFGYGQVIACEGTVALLQKEEDVQVLGPWYGRKSDLKSQRMLLETCFSLADRHTELVVDLLKSSSVKPLLAESGFHCVGRNTLMVKGGVGGADLGAMMSLASLGSFG